MNKKQLNKVLESKMDRKEFLRYMGLVGVSLMGVSRFTNIYKKPLDKLKSKEVESQGYGSSPYGK